MARSTCWMDISIGGRPEGRITFALYDGQAPRTTQNFLMLCTGEKGIGKTTKKPLHYKHSTFHRVIPGFMVQGGDTTKGDGTGGRSIFGNAFDDETFALRHRGPGILAMANAGPGTNGSQFFVTTRSAPHLDGRHVVFGCVLEGYEVVRAVEACGTASGRPARRAKIAACGSVQAGA